MMRRFCVVALVCLAPIAARAEATGDIDWARQVIKAHGQGAPDLNAPSTSAARIGAERAAKADALRNLLETLKGAQLSNGNNVGTLLQSDKTLRGKVEGTLRGFTVVSPHYYSDGGVGLDVEIPLSKLPPELASLLPANGGANLGSATAQTQAVPGPAVLPAPVQEASTTPAQAVEPAPIDWSAGVLQARGEGQPNLSAGSISAARLGAERAARLDAVRVLMVALKSGSAPAASMLQSDSALGAKVDGALRGYKVSKVHYYSDGGVAIDVELALDQLPPELRAQLHAP